MSSPFSMLTQGLNRTILFSSIPGYDETFGPKIWKIRWPHFRFLAKTFESKILCYFETARRDINSGRQQKCTLCTRNVAWTPILRHYIYLCWKPNYSSVHGVYLIRGQGKSPPYLFTVSCAIYFRQSSKCNWDREMWYISASMCLNVNRHLGLHYKVELAVE